MTLRSLLCLDYGSGICMRRAPRDLCIQFEKVQCREHMVNKRSYEILGYNIHWIIILQLVP